MEYLIRNMPSTFSVKNEVKLEVNKKKIIKLKNFRLKHFP